MNGIQFILQFDVLSVNSHHSLLQIEVTVVQVVLEHNHFPYFVLFINVEPYTCHRSVFEQTVRWRRSEFHFVDFIPHLL